MFSQIFRVSTSINPFQNPFKSTKFNFSGIPSEEISFSSSLWKKVKQYFPPAKCKKNFHTDLRLRLRNKNKHISGNLIFHSINIRWCVMYNWSWRTFICHFWSSRNLYWKLTIFFYNIIRLKLIHSFRFSETFQKTTKTIIGAKTIFHALIHQLLKKKHVYAKFKKVCQRYHTYLKLYLTAWASCGTPNKFRTHAKKNTPTQSSSNSHNQWHIFEF